MKTPKGNISVSDTISFGLPGSKSYLAKTPKILKIIGDGLMTIGSIGTMLNLKNPTVAIVCGVSGLVGKWILKCFGEK
jgi:hypothetical protein